MISLNNVTLLMVDCLNYERAKNVFKHCLSKVNFADAKFITSFAVEDTFTKEYCVKIDPIETKRQYSFFMLSKLNSYFNTDFCLTIQYDGFILDEAMWTDEFLEYDYIGATWPTVCLDDGVPAHFNVGNGGFSLRSKRLHTLLQKDINIVKNKDEDKAICQINRSYLEYYHQIKFAPEHVADKFSFEYLDWLERPVPKTFGGHNCQLINTKKSRYLDIEV